jgi:hypothetical protein
MAFGSWHILKTISPAMCMGFLLKRKSLLTSVKVQAKRLRWRIEPLLFEQGMQVAATHFDELVKLWEQAHA